MPMGIPDCWLEKKRKGILPARHTAPGNQHPSSPGAAYISDNPKIASARRRTNKAR